MFFRRIYDFILYLQCIFLSPKVVSKSNTNIVFILIPDYRTK